MYCIPAILVFFALFLISSASDHCESLVLNVTATAANVAFSVLPNPSNATQNEDFLHNSFRNGPPLNGTHNIADFFLVQATYCKPSTNDRNVLQVLSHGATYDKSLWTGICVSDLYNWLLNATAAGYHTIAVDRVGHGANSGHPDPNNVVQGPLHIDVLHQIIQSARSGNLSTASGIPAFDRVVYVGHSYGSSLGNHLALAHPNDVDAYILTGFSSAFTFPTNFLYDLIPAAAMATDNATGRFRSLPLGYFSSQTLAARTSSLYAGNFDNSTAACDFNARDTFTIGEALSPGLTAVVADEYKGSVFVATGDKDGIFCGLGPATCAATLNKTAELFPHAARFGTFVAPETGHTLMLHFSAPDTVRAIHSWLDGVFGD